jgi:hypothetical protein
VHVGLRVRGYGQDKADGQRRCDVQVAPIIAHPRIVSSERIG